MTPEYLLRVAELTREIQFFLWKIRIPIDHQYITINSRGEVYSSIDVPYIDERRREHRAPSNRHVISLPFPFYISEWLLDNWQTVYRVQDFEVINE